MGETALILPVPEAEPLVGAWRAKYDSSAAVGVPAHITLLYPFLAPDAVGAGQVAELTALFASMQPVDVVFARTGRFGASVLFLAPEPEDALLDLMRRVWAGWPACAPYGGAIARDAVRPHLTVAEGRGREHVDGIELAVGPGLPLAVRLEKASLIENRTGRWTLRQEFALGG